VLCAGYYGHKLEITVVEANEWLMNKMTFYYTKNDGPMKKVIYMLIMSLNVRISIFFVSTVF
jgi:hypothetical protein